MTEQQWWADEPAGLSVMRCVVDVPTKGGPHRVQLFAVGALLAEAPTWLVLSGADRARLARMRLLDDRRRFWTARALVAAGTRAVYGPTSGWQFGVASDRRGGTTKPRWLRVNEHSVGAPIRDRDDGSGDGEVLPEVSISHAESVVVVALCAGVEVGVDVQDVASVARAGDALDVMFRPSEHRAFSSAREVAAAFTAKEAVLKAVGWGLAVDPLALEVAGEQVIAFDAPQARPVVLRRLRLPDAWGDYAAHLAVVRE